MGPKSLQEPKGHVKTEAEIRIMKPGNTGSQKLEEARILPQKLWREYSPADTLILSQDTDFWNSGL